MKKKKIIFSLMAVAMLSVAGFSAAKQINKSNLSDQMQANIEAISCSCEMSSKDQCANHLETASCWVAGYNTGTGSPVWTEIKGKAHTGACTRP